ncbi:MAG: reductive dehalogenase [Candidatus Krumholzibacteria bacterium]|nr:reductive dehalogenase [Candidatus Krumholzibacteria bacterium]
MSAGPTYVIEGEIRRFDERDTAFSREALIEGSPNEIAYHTMYPEKIEIDRKLARFITLKMEPGCSDDHFADAIYEAHFKSSAALALPDMVDGEPASEKTDWSPAQAAAKVKAFARAIGADDVRIGPLKQEWVYSHRGSRPFFEGGYSNAPYFSGIPEGYQGARYGDPVELGHSGAISMAFDQKKDLVGTGSTRAVDFEVGRVYAKSVLASVQLARFIRALGYPARAHHLRNYLIMLVPVAVDSGIGELGRCGYIVSRKSGANLRLATVTTDMPLEFDDPVDIGMQDFCDKCKKCAVTCPSGAIPLEKTLVNGSWRWKLNPEACLQYWGHTGYTCGICQTVCPWTKPHNIFHRSVASAAVNLPWIRRALVKGDDVVYGAGFSPLPVPRWLEDG